MQPCSTTETAHRLLRLQYFTALFEEVDRLEISAPYWHYVAQKMTVLEQRWLQSTTAGTHQETK